MDKNETPPNKVKKMNDTNTKSCKPEDNKIGGLNIQRSSFWLRKSTDKTASRQTVSNKNSARKLNLGQNAATNNPSEQVTAAQVPGAFTVSAIQPLASIPITRNGRSLNVPQHQSAKFVSSFVPVSITHTGTMLPANCGITHTGQSTMQQANCSTAKAKPNTKLQASFHISHPKHNITLQASSHPINTKLVSKLHTNYHTTSTELELNSMLQVNRHTTSAEPKHTSALQVNRHTTSAEPKHTSALQVNRHTTSAEPKRTSAFQVNHHTTSAEPKHTSALQVNRHTTSTEPKHTSALQVNRHTTSSLHSSVPSSMTIAQSHSQMIKVPFLEPTTSNPQIWSAYEVQKTFFQTSPTFVCQDSHISSEYNSHTSSAEKNIITDGQTCPEITETPRSWHSVQQSNSEVGSLEFTVMSYNILSQELLVRHMHLYTNCKESDLEWANRGPALLTQIIAHNADIICLQEVQEDHWSQDIKVMLAEQGYHGVYKRKEDGDKPDGCAILFKTTKFKKLKFVPVEFMKGGILDRSNVGIILMLQPRKEVYGGSVKKMCVATTHLLFNPRRGDVKLAQLVVFLAEIDKHAYQLSDVSDSKLSTSANEYAPNSSSSNSNSLENNSQVPKGEDVPETTVGKGEPQTKHHYCPIILCGDFNSEPFCDLYKFITTGYIKYDQLVSRLVCGQKEGQMWGTDRTVDKILLPKSLSISESCQYINVLKKRRNTDDGAIQHHKVNSGQFFHGMNFQSVYRHYVDLPGQGKKKEISSRHNNCSCTVDYIFYSTSKARQQQVNPALDTQSNNTGQGHGDSQSDRMRSTTDVYKEADTFTEPLELLARYSLLTNKELAKYRSMPNSLLPSDHLCLIARFLLR